MGRPLNKKFFGDPAGAGYQIEVLADQGSGNVACYIVSQRSNSTYVIADVATGLVVTSAKLVDGTPTAPGEMQVIVTPENGATPEEAEFTFDTDSTVNNASVTDITITNPGYGYWVGGTFEITIASDAGFEAGVEAVITYTVANGSIATAVVTTPGSGYTEDLAAAVVVSADIPDEAANPPVQSAKIINARRVKTFEGNTYVWPTTGGLGDDRGGLAEAEIGS